MADLGRYITTCISITGDDLDRADRLVVLAKEKGWTAVTRSDIIRFAIRELYGTDIPDAPENGSKLAPGR